MTWLRRNATTLLGGLLGASLVLNLALGYDRLRQALASPPPRGFGGMVARMEKGLPEPDRARFRAAMERHKPSFEPALEAMRAARPAVDEAIRTTPFDPERLRAASAIWADRWHDFSVRYGEAVAEALKDLSPEGRAAFAQQSRPPESHSRGGRPH